MKNTLIPTLFFPYAVCLGIACMSSGFIMGTFFRGSELKILLPLLLLWAIAIACNMLYIHKAKSMHRRSRSLMKELLAVKLWQLPAYIVMAYVCIVHVRDLRLMIELLTVTYMSLILVSFTSSYAIFRSYKHRNISTKKCIMGIICQFVPFVDIISLAYLYNKVNKRRRHHYDS